LIIYFFHLPHIEVLARLANVHVVVEEGWSVPTKPVHVWDFTLPIWKVEVGMSI